MSCRDCKHFSGPFDLTPYGQERSVPVLGMCNAWPSEWDWRIAANDPSPQERVILVDANAAMLVRPDFGCDGWEPNEESRLFWSGAALPSEHDPAVCSECARRVETWFRMGEEQG